MKKMTAILLTAGMIFSLTACGKAPAEAPAAAPAEETAPAEEAAPAEAPAPAEEEKEQEVPAPAEETAEAAEAAGAEEAAGEEQEAAEDEAAPADEAGPQIASAHLDQDGKGIDVTIDLSDGWSVEFAAGAFYLYEGPYSEDKESTAMGITLEKQVFEEYCEQAAASDSCRDLDGTLVYTADSGENCYLVRVGEDAFMMLTVKPETDGDAVFSRVKAQRGMDGLLTGGAEEIDYLALVNKCNALPEGWEDALDTVHITNSVGDDVEVESKAYLAYLKMAHDLAENDGIYTELDSARRSVAAQQEIMDCFTEKYGADYAAKTVAKPGFSEHHTGLALDLYFKTKNEDGSFSDVYYNEDMEKEEYKETWAKIHEKLADYGFILRYLEGKEHITGYRYEPWHIRYVDSPDIAHAVMDQPGLTFEEYLAGEAAPEVEIDLSGSSLYTEEELQDAMLAIKCEFASWQGKGCELHSIRYAGDKANSKQNLAWLNSLNEEAGYTQVAEFLMDYQTAADIGGAWEPDFEYKDYQWWLARPEGGDWEIVSWGY